MYLASLGNSSERLHDGLKRRGSEGQLCAVPRKTKGRFTTSEPRPRSARAAEQIPESQRRVIEELGGRVVGELRLTFRVIHGALPSRTAGPTLLACSPGIDTHRSPTVQRSLAGRA